VCLAPERMPPRITDTEHRFADPTRAKEVLGWRPRHDLFSGISSTVMWYQANPGAWSVADDRRPDTL
jgi:nucleoside-diphosphate-sugar epimerase